ncbi:MAG: hypothetical protein ACLR8P_12755 [Clostridium fessum]
MSSQSARLRYFTNTTRETSKLEPMELAYVDVPDEFTGAVIQKLTSRKG